MAAPTKLKAKQVLLYLIIAFVIVSVWKDPATSADYAGDFLGQVGGFFKTLYSKIAEFMNGLSN
jgi:hypothetical protein